MPESLMQDMVTLELAGEQVCAMERKALTSTVMSRMLQKRGSRRGIPIRVI